MRKLGWFFIVSVALSFLGCLDLESFPNEPQITFKSFNIAADGNGAALQISFTDGDGNFGLNQEDTAGVFADVIITKNKMASG
jgi:hypothetical protein